MLKFKQLAGCALLLLSTSSWSAGFYLGAGMGPESANFNQNSQVTQLSNFNVHDSTNLSGTGVFGSLFGGYGWTHQRFYVAGELNVNTSSVAYRSSNKEFINSNFTNNRYSIPFGYGVSVIPGYLIQPTTLFFARLGYEMGSFQLDTRDTSIGRVNKNLNGVRYGFGVRQELCKHLAAILEYGHVDYQNVSMTTFDAGSSTLKSTNITPSTSQAQFALAYTFA